jgi:arsenate reductase
VLTVCDHARETCPVDPGHGRRLHHSFEDPPGEGEGTEAERLAIFRRVRDEIRVYLRKCAADLLVTQHD